MFVQVGHYKAVMLTCSTPFTSASWGTLPTTQGVCFCFSTSRAAFVCLCCLCVQKCDWVVVSICLDLLVILALLFRGNKKVKRKRRVGGGGGRKRVTGPGDCFKLSSSFSLWVRGRLKEGKMEVCSLAFTEKDSINTGLSEIL